MKIGQFEIFEHQILASVPKANLFFWCRPFGGHHCGDDDEVDQLLVGCWFGTTERAGYFRKPGGTASTRCIKVPCSDTRLHMGVRTGSEKFARHSE